MKTPIIQLTPPQLEQENIQEKITCIRAHRERLFRTEAEQIADTFIFHNYGQGGAGWTFLFGCVNESMRQFDCLLTEKPTLKHTAVCVIGAGCYGLLTAILLAQRGINVKIVAENMTDISSQKAAGFFFPRPRKSSTPEERAIFYARGVESYKAYLAIAQGTHEIFSYGAKIVPAYFGLDINPQFDAYIHEKMMPAPDQVSINFGTLKNYDALQYYVPFIDAHGLMQQLQDAVKNMHIPITQKKIEHFEEVTEDIIFNCSALGAKKLTHDARLIPVQGHLISLRNQPDVTQLQYMLNFKVVQQTLKGGLRDELIYFAPKEEGILGITFLRGQDGSQKNEHEFERLLERCRNFFS